MYSRTAAPELASDFPGYADWLNTDHPYELADFRGKFVLLDFWTYCCINCMHVLPDLAQLEEKYDEELVVIGVHSPKFKGEQDLTNVRQALQRYNIRHPVVNDYQFEMWDAYGARAWPTSVLIDPEGTIVTKHSGEGILEAYDELLAAKIAEADRQGLMRRSPFNPVLELAQMEDGVLSFPGKVFAHPDKPLLVSSDSNHHRCRRTGTVERIVCYCKIQQSPGRVVVRRYDFCRRYR